LTSDGRFAVARPPNSFSAISSFFSAGEICTTDLGAFNVHGSNGTSNILTHAKPTESTTSGTAQNNK
jgi:hypothetical protein